MLLLVCRLSSIAHLAEYSIKSMGLTIEMVALVGAKFGHPFTSTFPRFKGVNLLTTRFTLTKKLLHIPKKSFAHMNEQPAALAACSSSGLSPTNKVSSSSTSKSSIASSSIPGPGLRR